MSNIREVLILEDQFTSGLNNYIKFMEKGTAASKETAAAAKMVQQQARAYEAALRVQTAEMNRAAAQSRAEAASIRQKAAAEREAERQSAAAAKAQKQYNQSMQEGNTAASKLTSTLRGMVGAYVGLQGVKGLLNMSDTLVSTTARLDMMNDGLQTTNELNQMIFASANRTRTSYAETAAFVAQLGSMAGDAFSSSAEIVAFAEQINKQLIASGASGESASAAIFQLQQALASGVLRGEELNSVMEQTPVIAQSIINYLGISKGELREMAAEGAITADIVKNAMFAAAEETNARFEKMSITWSQVFTVFGNYAMKILQPVLLMLSVIADNIQIIGPLVLGAAGAFAVFQFAANWTKIATVATGAYNAAVTFLKVGYGLLRNQTMAAAIAQHTYNSALLASPITWVVMGLALVVGGLCAGVAAYNKFTDSSVSATGIIAGVMSALGAHVYNTVAFMYNIFAVFANFIANVFNNPVAAVKILFYDMAQTVLGYLLNIASGIEDVINKIPGVTVDLTSGVESWINSLGAKSAAVKESSGWTEYFAPMEYKDYSSAFSSGYDKGSNLFSNIFGGDYGGIGSYSGGGATLGDINDTLGGIGSDVSGIKKSVDMSQEDIQMIVDMASQKYVNKINLTAQTPVITINGANTGNTEADRKALADTLKTILLEQAAAGSFRSTARIY